MSIGKRLRQSAMLQAGEARPIRWSGYDWTARPIIASQGPGPNAWSDSPLNLSVDQNDVLTLTIADRAGTFTCPELRGPTLGYGKYSFEIATNPTSFDIKPVLGLFTYDDTDDGSNNYREIDIEITKWNYIPEPSRIWYTVQPSSEPHASDHGVTSNTPYTTEFTWQAGQVYFRTVDSLGNLLGEHVVTTGTPTPGNETVRLNLWLANGDDPTNGLPVSVVVNSFTFTPSATYTIPAAASKQITFANGADGMALKQGASIVSNKLTLVCQSTDYALAFSGSVFNLTGSSIDTRVSSVPEVGNHTTEAIWFVRYDADNYFAMFFADGLLFSRIRSAASNTQVTTTYDPVQHLYWRIREASGTVYFETSPDRSIWTVRWSQAHSFGIKLMTMRARYECGYYGTETNPSPMVIDGINIT